MKRKFKRKIAIFSFLLFFFFVGISFGQGFKITELSEDTSPTSDDLLLTVDSPGTTPANKKVQIGNLPFVLSSGGTFTGGVTFPDGTLGSLSIKYGSFSTTGLYAANFTPYGICQAWVNEGAAGGYLCGEGVTFGTSQAVNWNDDITIFREQAGFLGIGYQGVSPAQFDVWGVYTDGNNNEKIYLKSAAGIGTLGVSSAGSGSANINIAITPKGTGNLIVGHTTMVGGAGSGYIEAHVSSDIGGLNLINWSTADTNRSIVSLQKAGNATKGTHGLVANNEYIGTFLFHASDGSAFREVAVIQALIDGAPDVNDTPGRLVFGTTPDGNVSAVERYRIDNAGKHYWWLTSPGMGAAVTGNYEGLSLTLSSGAATFAAETGGTGADNVNIVMTPSGTGMVVLGATQSPASNAACTAGGFTWDTSYIYVCTATGIVKRVAITGGY